MEMYYPPARAGVLRERLVFLATQRYGLSRDLADRAIDSFLNPDGSLEAEDALLELRRLSLASGVQPRKSNLLSDEGLRVLRLLYEQSSSDRARIADRLNTGSRVNTGSQEGKPV